LPGTGEVTIGRSSECQVRIEDTAASRKHAVLRLGAEVSLEDLAARTNTNAASAAKPAVTARLRRDALARPR
jgi:two-component system response regulator AtoC